MGPLPVRRSLRDGRFAVLVLFLPPALVLFTLFVVLPIGEAAWYSGFNWNGFGKPTNWIGLDNYRFVLETRAFWLALRNNGLIIAVSLLIQLPLALALALTLAERFRGAIALRMLFFLPYILAYLLASTDTAMLAVLVVIVWKYFGFHMMLFIAALQGMDRNLVEAARIDGATRPQLLGYVVIPLLYPTIRLSVFFAIVGSLQLFDLVMPLTRGGPADSSNTMVSFLYNNGISRMRVGYGSAIGVILFVICVTFAFTYKRWFMRDE